MGLLEMFLCFEGGGFRDEGVGLSGVREKLEEIKDGFMQALDHSGEGDRLGASAVLRVPHLGFYLEHPKFEQSK